MKLSEDVQDKLLAIFQNRLVLIWKEKCSPTHHVSDFSIEDRVDISLRWQDYVRQIGGKIQDWGEAVRQDGEIVIRNPCECFNSIYNPSNNYIVLSRELASKILVLGRLP